MSACVTALFYIIWIFFSVKLRNSENYSIFLLGDIALLLHPRDTKYRNKHMSVYREWVYAYFALAPTLLPSKKKIYVKCDWAYGKIKM